MQFRGKVQRRTIAARCCFSFFFFVLLPFVLAFNQIKTSRWTASERNFFDLRARQIKLNLTSLVCYDYLTVNGQPRRSFCIYALSIRWTRFDASWNWNWMVCATILCSRVFRRWGYMQYCNQLWRYPTEYQINEFLRHLAKNFRVEDGWRRSLVVKISLPQLSR